MPARRFPPPWSVEEYRTLKEAAEMAASQCFSETVCDSYRQGEGHTTNDASAERLQNQNAISLPFRVVVKDQERMKPTRRFPPPWTFEGIDAAFVVKDGSGQKVAYVYYEEEPGRHSAAKPLTKDEAVIRIRLRSFHRLRSMWGLRLRNRLLHSLRYLASVDRASSG
jgi:hypothetical protein